MRYSLIPKHSFRALSLGSLLLSAPVLVGTATAQNFLLETGQFDGKKISSVEIRYRGAKTVDEAKLRSHMAVAAGKTYSQTVLDGDIKTLYASGLVDDVQFFAEDVPGGVKVIAEVVTRPLISGLGFDGNSTFSDGKLARETKLSVGQVLSDAQIIKARKNLEKLYEGYGYPDVTVTHRLQASSREGYADLIFVVGEGDKSEVYQIRFEGNNALKDADLRKEMSTKEKGWFSWFTKSGRINQVALDEDIDKVEDFYKSKGYWRARVGVPKRVPRKGEGVDLVIPVDEGPLYTVNSISFPNIKVFTSDELLPALSLVGNMPYSSKKVRDDIRMIRSYYGSRGYADVSVVPDVREADGGRVNIFYRITPGTRKKVGRVNIQGNTKSQDKVIRREIPMRPGENFNSVDIETTKRRLSNLNYFDDVQVTSSNSSEDGYRDLNVLVSEKKTGSINFGAGFSSVDNIVGFINLEQTNFDITNWGRFTGAGQRFSASLRGGAQRTDFRLSLVEPWFLGKKLSLGTELFYRDLLFLSDEFEQTNVGGAVFLRKPVGRKAYIKGEYRLERIDIDADDDTSQAFLDEDGSFLRSALSLNYVYDSRDSNKLPRRGHKVDLGVAVAGGFLGGDVDTFTITGTGTKHWNMIWDTILTARGSFAVVNSINGSDDDVPIFERHFLGGARDLRGFEFRDIGPRDPVTQEVLGGNTSFFGSLELTFPITTRVRGAAFYDLGFVNEDSYDFSASNLASDVGLGLRLDLPIGPLAVDYAIPLSTPDDEADNGGQFNFYLNYQF
ncbi:outer membrane protein assembly factor BamA [bacterium]|nr:outer membrane protein assembly factor BamA [bacterium]MDB4265298.1 outer membrane protein assembly factor BamA [bacterium]